MEQRTKLRKLLARRARPKKPGHRRDSGTCVCGCGYNQHEPKRYGCRKRGACGTCGESVCTWFRSRRHAHGYTFRLRKRQTWKKPVNWREL